MRPAPPVAVTAVCESASVSLPCAWESVRAARKWTDQQLRRLFERAYTAGEDAELVISELVTNCLRAEAHTFSIAIEAHHSRVTLCTIDDAPGVPAPRSARPTDDTGRGLAIVEALSNQWGVRPGPHSKTVWADVPIEPDAEPRFDCDDEAPGVQVQ